MKQYTERLDVTSELLCRCFLLSVPCRSATDERLQAAAARRRREAFARQTRLETLRACLLCTLTATRRPGNGSKDSSLLSSASRCRVA